MKCIYAGSFDPITYGHMDVVEKSCKTFDEVVIVVADSPGKNYMFNAVERASIINSIYLLNKKVSCTILPKGEYVADFGKRIGASHIVRGLRNSTDLLYEQGMYEGNKIISPELESVFFMPSKEVEHISSSSVKSFLGYSGYSYMINSMVHPIVKNKLSAITLKNIFNKYKPCFELSANVIGAYSDTRKHYHNLSHIVEMFLELERIDLMETRGSPTLFSQCEANGVNLIEWIIILAILYHDVVYDCGSQLNESKSIDFFVKEFSRNNTTQYDGIILNGVSKVIDSTRMDWDKENTLLLGRELFMNTGCNQVQFDEYLRYACKIVRTLDWRVLCLQPDRYDQYSDNIRKEVAAFNKSNFNVGRKKFLANVDLRKFIDFSLLPQGSYEMGIENIRREIKSL